MGDGVVGWKWSNGQVVMDLLLLYVECGMRTYV